MGGGLHGHSFCYDVLGKQKKNSVTLSSHTTSIREDSSNLKKCGGVFLSTNNEFYKTHQLGILRSRLTLTPFL